MKIKVKGHCFASALVWLATGTVVGKTLAQPIVPANDGTGTTVTPAGNRYDISGGQTSGDGRNLFHTFQKFGLSNEQIVNFLSTPNVHNILTRINGKEPSLINGLITVTGGNPNLFLINPAGIVFGPSATLNVPASFTATTATSIGFNSGLFRAFGTNDYASLVGDPLAFDFASIPTGSILNLGNLTAAKDLNLLGGTVLSTGTLSAPQGNITIASVSGTNRIRISQTGQVLSLELPAIASIEPAQISPLTLPELLTGTPLGHATQIIVTEAGEVRLTGMTSSLNAQTEVPVKPGDIAIAGNPLSLSHRPLLSAGSATLSAAQTLTLTTGTLESTGNLNLLAGDTIRVRDSLYQPFNARTGGDLTLRGNLGIDILALNHPQAALQAGQNLSLISDGAISGDAHFLSGGDVSIINLKGEFGNFLSLYDPIIRATGNVNFGNYTGTSLKVEATGEIVAGNINITGPDTALPDASDPDAATLSSSAALILRSGVPALGDVANVPPNQTSGGTAFVPSASPLANGITAGEISTAGGPAILQAAGEITIDTLATAGGNVDFTAGADITVLGAINTGNNGGNSGSVNLNSATDIDLSAIDTQGVGDFAGGEVNLQAGNFLRVGNGFRDGNNVNASISSVDAFGGGDISIRHAGGRTAPFVVGDGATNGTAAAITTGSSLISPRFEVPMSPTGVYRQGNITISTNGFNRSSRMSEIPSQRLSNIASDLAGRDVLVQRNIIQPQESEIQTKLRTLSRVDIAKAIDNLEIPEAILFIDILFTEEVGYYIQENIKREVQSFKQVQEKLAPIAAKTGLKPAIIAFLK
ncbi:filamentous hemagglutinin N-terminal domain-containing protein [Microcoleus sp. FACHB-672]|uniref:filamentous hemagglutinin N-terminal domain-containing protein n=1 Tax=Microcoleus sp. FACHB-672 TaxID=2692825 RepID=UPI00168423FA|nr:filamentous hemagglutinin N-terminal domain-containing protein [Microcoleus sp. FACHB-672]MBD2042807.1 filamentous hemagglutinin N-terminal domain-containing protein [Microcoleus sp. FACHB-672]